LSIATSHQAAIERANKNRDAVLSDLLLGLIGLREVLQSTRGRHYMFLWQHQQDHTPTARGRRSAEPRAHTRGSECGQRSSDSPDNNASSFWNTSSDVPEKQNLVDDAVDPSRAPNGAYRSFPSMPGLADTLSAIDIQRLVSLNSPAPALRK
jgi:hypothetical protein